MDRLRDFFEVPIRWSWVTLGVPALYALKFAFFDFDPWPGDAWPAYPFAWGIGVVALACVLVPIQLCYAHLAPRLAIENLGSRRAIAFHVLVIVGCALLGGGLANVIVAPILPPPELDPTHEWAEIPLLLLAGTIAGAPIVLRGMHYRDALERSRTRALRAEREALAAQVQALQARIQPHFLFNALNTVASLIHESPRCAEHALERIAALFRYALDASAAPTVPLARELEAALGYLDLERLRFPDRLHLETHVEPGVGDVPVPPLFLQPLVENAVRHGIAPRAEGGRLSLRIARESGRLRVCIEDDGPGPGGSEHTGAGVALADLRKRLALMYGDEARLDVDRSALGGCRVALQLPLEVPPPSAEGRA